MILFPYGLIQPRQFALARINDRLHLRTPARNVPLHLALLEFITRKPWSPLYTMGNNMKTA